MKLLKSALRKRIEVRLSEYESQIASMESEKAMNNKTLPTMEHAHLICEISRLRDKLQLLKSLL